MVLSPPSDPDQRASSIDIYNNDMHMLNDDFVETDAAVHNVHRATGQEAHGIEVDFDIFEKISPPDPALRHAVYHAMDLDFRLKAGSKATQAWLFQR